MIKAYVNKLGEIVKIEQVGCKEIFVDIDIDENPVICELDGSIKALKESKQGKNKLVELEALDVLSEEEYNMYKILGGTSIKNIKFLDKETQLLHDKYVTIYKKEGEKSANKFLESL